MQLAMCVELASARRFLDIASRAISYSAVQEQSVLAMGPASPSARRGVTARRVLQGGRAGPTMCVDQRIALSARDLSVGKPCVIFRSEFGPVRMARPV